MDFKNPNAKVDTKNMTWRPLLSQTGFQAATGKYSFVDPEMQQLVEKGEKIKGQIGGSKENKEEKLDSALLLWGFVIAILAGTVFGLIMPSSLTKKGILILCCLVALGAVGAQTAIGFPISKQKDDMKGMGGNNNAAQLGLKPEDLMRTSYKIPFYLTFLFCVGAIATTLLEESPMPRKKKRHIEEDEVSDDEPPDQKQDW
jgi:hypothetical protein